MIKYLLVEPLFAAIFIGLFVAIVSALIWLGEAAGWLSEFWDSYGGLVLQLGAWAVGITFVLLAFLRLVALLSGALTKKESE
ncbi:hypothetical protein [uncultured Erythrobacter sp.]|uniref:hypothetical protein n=1 Tax=uncultured Erythrobacter sp. TaxID=263913 RepID=UPI002658927D|nr:hypothetical protein [uncultured Erythrobacter sp.]